MHRKSLALIATGLFLFLALLGQMNAVQAATPAQDEPAPTVGEPLAQPLRIIIRQRIPMTISLPASVICRLGGSARVRRKMALMRASSSRATKGLIR